MVNISFVPDLPTRRCSLCDSPASWRITATQGLASMQACPLHLEEAIRGWAADPADVEVIVRWLPDSAGH